MEFHAGRAECFPDAGRRLLCAGVVLAVEKGQGTPYGYVLVDRAGAVLQEVEIRADDRQEQRAHQLMAGDGVRKTAVHVEAGDQLLIAQLPHGPAQDVAVVRCAAPREEQPVGPEPQGLQAPFELQREVGAHAVAEDRERIPRLQCRDGSAGEVVEGFRERPVKTLGHSVATPVEFQRDDVDVRRHQGCPTVIATRGTPGVGQAEKFHRYGRVRSPSPFCRRKRHRGSVGNTLTADRLKCERSAKLFITRIEAPLPHASPCNGLSRTLAEPREEWPGPPCARGGSVTSYGVGRSSSRGDRY